MADKHLNRERNDDLSIVCFGASSGGLETYLEILSLLPAETGFVFVLIHHQPADWKSLLPEIIPRYTDMPAALVQDGEIVHANRVYISPPGMQVYIEDDRFRLTPLQKRRGWPRNISVFLNSLASNQSARAIVVILSGLDSDGACALKPIKEAGGIVIAQDFDTAKQPAMPINAVNTGHVDFLLPPAEIAEKLLTLAEQRKHRF